MTVISVSGRVAGPFRTEPSFALNALPWHAQLIRSALTLATVQLECVQTAVNALNVPSVGWVTTTF